MHGVPKIPYFTTSRYRVQTMVELADIKSTDKGADLGTGDGRITIAMAKAGLQMVGYEIDPNLKKLAEENILKENLTNAIILDKDFWQEDLSPYSIICCYPMPTIMGKLERKLQEELQPGARVLLNYFPFLHWKAKTIKDNVYLYMK